jgi:hypothetical protein
MYTLPSARGVSLLLWLTCNQVTLSLHDAKNGRTKDYMLQLQSRP